MPYCQECGSHFEQDINTCSSCGNKLSEVEESNLFQPRADTEVASLEADSIPIQPLEILDEAEYTSICPEEKLNESEQLKKIAETNVNSILGSNSVEFIHQEGVSIGSHRNQVESHLRKGLIKPVTIENCMDGFHFKYDEPQRQINKVEPQNEKVIEFRVSGETEPIVKAKEDKEEEKVLQDISDSVKADIKKDDKAIEPEEIVESKSESESNSEEYHDDEVVPVEEGSLLEKELISDIVNPEPEIRSDIELDILWKGFRTWNGLKLKEEYQITDQSAILLNGIGQKLKEVEWRSVTKISLKQNWFSKLLGIGNLEIIGLDTEPLLILEGIDHPEDIQKMLVERVESKV